MGAEPNARNSSISEPHCAARLSKRFSKSAAAASHGWFGSIARSCLQVTSSSA